MTKVETRYALAPIAAAMAAGPIFAGVLMIGAYLNQLPQPIPVTMDDITNILLDIAAGTIPVVLGGTLLSIVPNFFGTAAMAELGRVAPATRHPAIWGLAGGVGAFVPALILNDFDLEAARDIIIRFTFTGALCALVCRRFTGWVEVAIDDGEPAPHNHRDRPDRRLLR
jgi:hypothetical protein